MALSSNPRPFLLYTESFDRISALAGKACLPPWSGRPYGGHNEVQKARKSGLSRRRRAFGAMVDQISPSAALRSLNDKPYRPALRALLSELIWSIKWVRINKKGSSTSGGLIAPVESNLETAKNPGTWGVCPGFAWGGSGVLGGGQTL